MVHVYRFLTRDLTYWQSVLPYLEVLYLKATNRWLGALNTSTVSNYTVSHYIVSGSDICFGANQINSLNGQILGNALLSSVTLRACDNRLRETLAGSTGSRVSLTTHSTLANITANNQCDHCIVALGNSAPSLPVVDTGNQVLNPGGCQQMHNDISSRVSEIVTSYE